jgi:hypothetical protein
VRQRALQALCNVAHIRHRFSLQLLYNTTRPP